MCCPGQEEEASGVVKAVTGFAVECVDAAALCELVCGDDADEDGEDAGGEPPPEGVTEEVDLLAGIVFGPEGDAAEEEGPLDRLA